MINLIIKKELKSFFISPVTYIVLGLFMGITGYIFYNLLISFVENTQNLPNQYRNGLDFVNHVTIQLFTNINLFLLIFCPIISMRCFSEEKKNGTLDLYFASRVSDFELILGKFIALIIKGLVLLLPTLIFPIILWTLKAPDFTFVYAGFLGLVLNIIAYLSLGMFASACSSNQVVSAVISYVGILIFWMISWASQVSSNYIYATFFKYISLTKHFELISKGSLNLSSLMYFFTFSMVFIVLTKITLASRKW